MQARQPIVHMEGITKHFGGVTALEQVDFDIYPQEVHALVGDNGAGKSTLIKVLCGVHQQDEGKISIEGREVHIHNPKEARNLGIEVIHQDLALVDEFNTVANLYLGKELVKPIGARPSVLLDEPRMRANARSILDRVRIQIPDIRQRVYYLSGGQRQGVAISRAINSQQKINLLIMDEPTAALGVEEKGKVMDLIRRLKHDEVSVVVISHNLEDVFQVADRVTVLRNGKKAITVLTSEATKAEVVGYIVGAETDQSRREE